ncbi:4351_t:CDS:2, partial [Gigaspora rosea]
MIIQKDNKSIIVCEISHELEVLDLHKILTPVITQVNKNNSDANELAGYYAYQPSKKDSITWVSLLPRYTIYTKINDNYFKLSIMKDTNNQLIYQWYFYADDETFKIFKDSGQDNICFKTCFNKYNWSDNPFNTEKTLKNSLTQMKYQLQTAIEIEETPIRKGIALNKFGKYLSSHETQALMVEHNTFKNKLKNGKKTITRHKKYLSLVFENPCTNCGNYLISTRDCQLTIIEFKTKCLIRCKECETIIEISNEKKNICFSKAVAAGRLGARISRHVAQSFLATIGVTSQ